MRDAMIQLAGFLGRRRRWVVAVWVVIVVLALPFAAQQTEHLTGGGFDVPGSESKAVADVDAGRLRRRGGRDRRAAAGDAGRERRRARRGGRAGAARRSPTVEGVTLPPAVARRGEVQLQRTGSALVPLAQLRLARRADRLGGRPARRPRPGHRRRRGHALPGRAADGLGGDAGALQGRPRQGGGERLPDRRADPARRLRLAGRRGAAAGARLRQRDRHRGPDLLHLAADERPRSSSPTWPR